MVLNWKDTPFDWEFILVTSKEQRLVELSGRVIANRNTVLEFRNFKHGSSEGLVSQCSSVQFAHLMYLSILGKGGLSYYTLLTTL